MKENDMKRILKATAMTAALALGLVVLAGLTRAQDAKSIPSPEDLLKILAENGKPGAEHQRLQPFVGDWNLTVRLWTDASQPPAELTGTVERKWIMGGRFIQESVKGECHGKTFEGLGLLGYDSAQKKFTAVRVCGLCGTMSHDLVTCDDSGTKFVCAKEECCPLTGQKVQGRDEILVENNDRIVTNIYKTIQGKEAKVMEFVSIRKK
jgi:hypothetical protein